MELAMGPFVAALLLFLPTGSPGGATRPSPAPAERMDGNQFYVDPIRGSDEGSGRERGQPWRTLTHAISSAFGTPAVILLASGEYSEASGEHFPLRPRALQWIRGDTEHGVRILGPRGGDRSAPVFEIGAAYQSLAGLEIVTGGVAFDVTLYGGSELDIAAEVKARRAVDVHLRAGGDINAALGLSGCSFWTQEAAIDVEGA